MNKSRIVFIIILMSLLGGLAFFLFTQRGGITTIISGSRCGKAIVYNGDKYATVEIGDQCWLAENLRNTEDANGEFIERYCYQDDITNCEIYGGLYTWNEIMKGERINDNQGICPNGWHIPSNDEWKMLEIALGFPENEFISTGWRVEGEVGKKLKEEGIFPDGFWLEPNIADNSSGFSARGGGSRSSDGSYSFLNESGGWWSSTDYKDDYAWVRFLNYNSIGIDYSTDYKKSGLSVRCLKDQNN